MLSTVLKLAPLVVGGKPEQRHQRFLPPFLAVAKGAPLAAFALTEPGGSANVGSPPPGEGVRTTARRVGDSWVISGRKQWISTATGWDGQGADLLTVVCRTDPTVEPSRGISIIAVPRPDSGLIFEHAFDTLGHRAHLTPRFRLDAVQVPAGNLLGQEGGGLQLAAESFGGSGALVGIFGVALMRAAFQFALSSAKSEKRGGIQQIIQHQAVGYALADAKTTIEAARALSWHACRALDTAAPGALEAHYPRQGVRIGSQRCAGHYQSHAGCEASTVMATNCRSPVCFRTLWRCRFSPAAIIGVRRRQLHALMLDPA